MKVQTLLLTLALAWSLFSFSSSYAQEPCTSAVAGCAATGKGHKIFPIKELNVINKSKIGFVSYDPRYDIVSSGTYYYNNLRMSVGPILSVLSKSNSLYYGNPKALTRGILVKFTDGSIILTRIPNDNFSYKNTTKDEANELLDNSLAQIEKDNNKKIAEIMGGGALLIENGKKVSQSDLENLQFFDQGIGNLNGAQMRATQHVLVASKNGKAYVILSPLASGAKLQADLASFDNVIKFDGGSGCSFFVKGSHNLCTGHNVTGLGIKIGL